MTKNELMEVAREAGIAVQACPWTHQKDDWLEGDAIAFLSFYNAILERAAVECDWIQSMDGKNVECANSIRALKITTGEGDE